MTEKKCFKCAQIKPIKNFWKNRNQKDGYSPYCTPCFKKTYVTQSKLPDEASLILKDQEEDIQRIVQTLMLNPEWGPVQVAKELSLSPRFVSYQMKTNRYLNAVHILASKAVKGLVPKAVKAYNETLESKSDDVKLRSASKLLESEGILGPKQVHVDINDLRSKSDEELRKQVERISSIPQQTIIDAEVE